MSQTRKWYFYTEDAPQAKSYFSDAQNSAIEDAYMKALGKRGSFGLNLFGCWFDFKKMTYFCKKKTHNLAFTGFSIPYKFVLSDDVSGISPEDKKILEKQDKKNIITRWLWWDNPIDEAPMASFEANFEKKPMWAYFSPDAEKKIENLYLADSKSFDYLPISNKFCVCFNEGFKGYPIPMQSRINDEIDSDVPIDKRHRRPVFRASYCWCFGTKMYSGGMKWTAFPPDVSAYLEECLLLGLDEIEFFADNKKYIADFARKVRYNADKVSDMCEIERFGTGVINSSESNVEIPPEWEDFGEKKFLVSNSVSDKETSLISKIVNYSKHCTLNNKFSY